MMGIQVAPAQLFYDFCLDDHGPADHLLRRIDRFLDLESVRTALQPFYISIGRPSVDPELMMRMLIVGYCMGLRSALEPRRWAEHGDPAALKSFQHAISAPAGRLNQRNLPIT
jgi:hypothetical protein